MVLSLTTSTAVFRITIVSLPVLTTANYLGRYVRLRQLIRDVSIKNSKGAIMNIQIKFLEDSDDSCNEFEENGINIKFIPRVGECIYVNGFYHRVKDVIYYETSGICLHLGQSAQSPEEARSKGYGIWNS